MDNNEVKRLQNKLMLRVIVWGLIGAIIMIWQIGKHRNKQLNKINDNEARTQAESTQETDMGWCGD